MSKISIKLDFTHLDQNIKHKNNWDEHLKKPIPSNVTFEYGLSCCDKHTNYLKELNRLAYICMSSRKIVFTKHNNHEYYINNGKTIEYITWILNHENIHGIFAKWFNAYKCQEFNKALHNLERMLWKLRNIFPYFCEDFYPLIFNNHTIQTKLKGGENKNV